MYSSIKFIALTECNFRFKNLKVIVLERVNILRSTLKIKVFYQNNFLLLNIKWEDSFLRSVKESFYPLCLIASYKITPVATDTFNEAIFPFIGILARVSHIFKNSGETPSSSEPIMIALGFV